MQLTNISFAFTSTLVGNTTIAEHFFILGNGNAVPSFPDLVFLTVDVLGASPVDAFTSALPLGAGVYGIFDNGGQIVGGSPADPDFGFTADYTWSLTVAQTTAVPEPVSLLLFGTGLFGVALRRYRHQR